MTRGYDVRDSLTSVMQIRKASTSRAIGTGGIVAGCGIARGAQYGESEVAGV